MRLLVICFSLVVAVSSQAAYETEEEYEAAEYLQPEPSQYKYPGAPYAEPGYNPEYPPYEPAYEPPYQPEYAPGYPKPEYNPEYPKPGYKPDYGYKPAYEPEYPYKPEPYKPEPYKPEPYKPAYKPSYPKPGYSKPAYCDSTYTPTCAPDKAATFCFEDYEYPKYEIEAAIEQDYEFAAKYSDVADQSAEDLVDTISAPQEASFQYDFFNPESFDRSHWTGPEGYICPSSVGYVRPLRAKNAVGQWRVIVQDVKYYTQTIRTENCRFPDGACRLVAPCFQSKCTQKFIYERMLSWDPCDPYQGLFIDVYKVPSACSCHAPE